TRKPYPPQRNQHRDQDGELSLFQVVENRRPYEKSDETKKRFPQRGKTEPRHASSQSAQNNGEYEGTRERACEPATGRNAERHASKRPTEHNHKGRMR